LLFVVHGPYGHRSFVDIESDEPKNGFVRCGHEILLSARGHRVAEMRRILEGEGCMHRYEFTQSRAWVISVE
jgi:hypothetical protein